MAERKCLQCGKKLINEFQGMCCSQTCYKNLREYEANPKEAKKK